jgi:hypothetical protein
VRIHSGRSGPRSFLRAIGDYAHDDALRVAHADGVEVVRRCDAIEVAATRYSDVDYARLASAERDAGRPLRTRPPCPAKRDLSLGHHVGEMTAHQEMTGS